MRRSSVFPKCAQWVWALLCVGNCDCRKVGVPTKPIAIPCGLFRHRDAGAKTSNTIRADLVGKQDDDGGDCETMGNISCGAPRVVQLQTDLLVPPNMAGAKNGECRGSSQNRNSLRTLWHVIRLSVKVYADVCTTFHELTRLMTKRLVMCT